MQDHFSAVLISVLIVAIASGIIGSGIGVSTADSRQGVDADMRFSGQVQPDTDLSVFDFRGPPQANVGQTVTVSATIRNAGNTTETTSVQYRIAGQVIATAGVSIAPGDSVAVTLQGTVPSLATGTYQHGVFIGDSPSNGQTSQIVIGNPQAAFTILSLQAPGDVSVGESITATATVENTGDASGTKTFQYRIGQQVIDSREVTLGVGEQATLSFQGTVPTIAAGTYQQGVFLDTSNSGLTRSITVTTPAASFAIISLQASSRTDVGDEVTATVLVQNTGNVRGSTNLRYRIDGSTVAVKEITLEPGASQTVSLRGPAPDRPAGTYQQGVFIDPTDRGLTTSIILDERPSAYFRVSDLRVPAEAEVGDDITVRATITNTGTTTERTTIEYRIDDQMIESERVELAPDRSTTIRFDVEIPRLSRGTYTQGVFIEETNRGQTTSLRIREGSVFSVTNLVTTPTARVGDRISAEATIRNTGDERGTTQVEYYIGDRRIDTDEIRLDAGERQIITLSGTVPELPTGTYRQEITVAGSSQSTRLRVDPRPQPRPIFALTNFEAPSTAVIDDEITIRATLRNSGDADGTTTVDYRLNNRIITSRRISLDAGDREQIEFDVAVPELSPGPYQHGIFLTGTTQGVSGNIQIRAGRPRFRISNFRAPTSSTVGDRVTIQATVSNTGTGSGTVVVEYRFDGEPVQTRNVDLPAGEQTSVRFELTIPELTAGSYNHGIFIGDTRRGQSNRIRISARATPTPRVITKTVIKTPQPTTSPGLPGFGFIPFVMAVIILCLFLLRNPHH